MLNRWTARGGVAALLAGALALAGCAQQVLGPSYGYAPPAPRASFDNQRLVAADYDATWTGLIDHVSRTSFAIDQFEKASGLLTLRFGEADIQRYVDCGTWTENGINEPYAGRADQGHVLTGRMNIRVQPRGPGATDVRIDSLYRLKSNSGNVWQFTTNEPATINLATQDRAAGTTPIRTCQSTHEAERQILTGIEAVAATR